jgi:hypothetical protein
MSEVLTGSLVMIAQILLPLWLIRRDERRLPRAQQVYAFPEATFWIAIVCFGPLAVLVHFLRTRRGLRGLALGLAWLAVTLGLLVLLSVGLEKILGIFLATRL